MALIQTKQKIVCLPFDLHATYQRLMTITSFVTVYKEPILQLVHHINARFKFFLNNDCNNCLQSRIPKNITYSDILS